MKKYISNLTLILISGILVFGIFSCEKKTNCCTTIDTHVQILYKNQLGESLINSTSDFEESKIKVYYKNGNEFEYVYNGNLDAPNMHKVDEDENGNLILKVFLSNFYEGNESTTLVELNPNTVDTLEAEFELDDNREICKRAWLNGQEMNDRFIEVEK